MSFHTIGGMGLKPTSPPTNYLRIPSYINMGSASPSTANVQGDGLPCPSAGPHIVFKLPKQSLEFGNSAKELQMQSLVEGLHEYAKQTLAKERSRSPYQRDADMAPTPESKFYSGLVQVSSDLVQVSLDCLTTRRCSRVVSSGLVQVSLSCKTTRRCSRAV